MAWCVAFNPIKLRVILVSVDIPDATNYFYAEAVAKYWAKKIGGKVACMLPSYGEPKYAVFSGRRLVALGDNPNRLVTMFGTYAIIVPVETLRLHSIDDVMAYLRP